MPSTESLEVIWNFNKLDRVYMSGKRVFRFDQMYNQVYVRSDTTSGYTYSGLAQNTDLTSSSNIYLNSINTLDISDSKLQSDTACLKEAQYLLEKNKRVQDSIEITCLPLPHATVNKAFTIEDNNLSTFKNYYAIQSVSLPLDLSQNMSILGFRYNDTTDFQDLTSESGNIHELPTGR
ncbi:hypothetical protein CLABU_38160 [Clostridium acetobutylicum]|nr:hypothetical protein CLABU_38160 [Clostridium acetobutylicum]